MESKGHFSLTINKNEDHNSIHDLFYYVPFMDVSYK